jgi:DNA adenine methylase
MKLQGTFWSHLDIDPTEAASEKSQIVNVASVPKRSPFRYAGGKTWLVPRARLWLTKRAGADTELIELFAGGAIISLTAACEDLVKQATLVELDEGVAAVWEVIFGGDAEWLTKRIMTFDLTPASAREAIALADRSKRDLAFATIVKNRVNRGGILADGASFVNYGENGKGIRSRWYPTTLKRRIQEIARVSHKLRIIHGDAFEVCIANEQRTDVVYFIDPPYVKAGQRLYRYSEIDHDALFDRVARLCGDFLMTYDDHPEVRELAARFGFEMRSVPMKTTHHDKKMELLIGKDLSWMNEAI